MKALIMGLIRYSAYSVEWCKTKVVYLQRWHGWCHMKLLPSWRKFCVHHTTMHHVTSFKATFVRCISPPFVTGLHYMLFVA